MFKSNWKKNNRNIKMLKQRLEVKELKYNKKSHQHQCNVFLWKRNTLINLERQSI